MNNRPSQSQVAQNIQANIRQKPLEVQERIHRVARLLHGIIELTPAVRAALEKDGLLP